MGEPYIKLTPEIFYSPEYCYVMSRPGGGHAAYLYFALCAMALETGGRLCDTINGKVIPFNAKRIHVFEPYYSEKEIESALSILEESGLIKRGSDGVLEIANFDDVAGFDEDEEG